MRLLIPALLSCAILSPASAAWAASPEWPQCADVNNKSAVERSLAARNHILADRRGKPNYGLAVANLCGIKYTAGDYDAALADCDRAISINKTNAVAFVRRALIWVAKDDPKRAMVDYDEALRLDPRNPFALYHRGRLKKRLGDDAGGDADIARAKQIKPDIDQ